MVLLTSYLSGVKNYINFICLRWVFVAKQAFLQLQSVGLLLSCDVQASHCGGGFSCCGPQALGHSGFTLLHVGSVVVFPGLQSTGSIVVEHRLSCFMAYGILLNQRLNLCLLPWQADSLPLSHQGSSVTIFKYKCSISIYQDFDFKG